MSIYPDIRACLEKHLSEVAGVPVVSYENLTYSPTTGTPFIKTAFRPTLTRKAAMGQLAQQRYQGVFVCNTYTPENIGPGTSDAFADLILDAFAATTDISFTNASGETIILTVDYAERGGGFSNSPWYYTPVTIGWFIYN
jgi:hypothetical protein